MSLDQAGWWGLDSAPSLFPAGSEDEMGIQGQWNLSKRVKAAGRHTQPWFMSSAHLWPAVSRARRNNLEQELRDSHPENHASWPGRTSTLLKCRAVGARAPVSKTRPW